MARLLGIDYGTRRIGVAVSDETGQIALPLCVLDGRDAERAIGEIEKLCREKTAETLVIGLPVNMNGTRGPSAEAAARFGERLRARTGRQVAYWDERWSTRGAERVLIEADVSRARRKTVVDKLAAQLMLQNYLDAQGIGARAT